LSHPQTEAKKGAEINIASTPIVTDRVFDASARPLASYQPAFASGATATHPSGVLASQVTHDLI
jgi:hypothetical protein